MIPTSAVLHLMRLQLVGLQALCHLDEEQDRYWVLRVHNRPSVCVRDIPDNIGRGCSRYGVRVCGPLQSGRCQQLLMLVVFDRWKFSATTPPYPPHGIPIVCLHQTSGGRNRLHGHLALLRFGFPKYSSTPIHSPRRRQTLWHSW